MALLHATLCKIERKNPDSVINTLLPNTPQALDGAIFSLFEQAKTQFNRNANKRFGFFDASAENPLAPDQLKLWQEQRLEFLPLCQKLCQHLSALLASNETAFAANVLFAEEELLGQRYFYCLWLPLTDAIQSGNDMQPYHAQVINTQQLPYALRLHLDVWQSTEATPKYLTLLAARGNKAFSDAFLQWANFEEGIDTRKQTQEFLSIVDNFSNELNEEKAKQVKKTAIDYCISKDKIGDVIHIDELSSLMDKDAPGVFAEYASTQQETPTKEIHTDRASLKRYMRYFGRDHSLSISFSADRFGTDIIYHADTNKLSIEKIPKSLKAQLSGYENKNE